MANLTMTVRWYLKGVFPLPIYVPILSLIIITQLYTIEYLKSLVEFSLLTQMLLIPFIILIVGSHFTRNKLMTIFELSLLGSWKRIAISKLIVFAIGLLPFIVIEVSILLITKNAFIVAPILISLLVYASISILSSLSTSQLNAFMISIVFILLIPISAVELIENYASLGVTSGSPMGMILYFLTPLVSFEYHRKGVISVNPLLGLVVTFFLAIIMIVVYVYLFQREEFKP
ncbi:MAG: hypothetical protein M1166_05920 [Candidatus Thermoplasmatota archaeon]|nr:hypothetical protein [Candidatus Thermoplasmatota archaeon]